MKNLKFVFLILHYINIDETIKCIDSINSIIDDDKMDIVVVDNGSNNGTFEKLKYRYNGKKYHFLKSEENLGFARGNNIGFKYAKKNLNPDFIIMINSDTIMFQKEFCKLIADEYENKKFHVMGPDIIDLSQTNHSNPCEVNFNNKNEIIKRIKNLKFHIFLCKTRLEYIYLLNNRLLRHKNKNNIKWRDYQEDNIELHGSCLIFSKDYIKRYDGISPETFLYYEESFLHYICQRDNLKEIYNPKIKIIHNESKSTKSLYKNVIKRKRFYYENALNSCIRLVELVEKQVKLNNESYTNNNKE